VIRDRKVIIVDDEPIILAGRENWLSRRYVTLTYGSAEAFLDAFNQTDCDDGLPTCLLLDFQMPGMTGTELQAFLKTIKAAFPIIFMSGNATQTDIISAWRGGAVDYILKPFTPTQITDALDKQFDALKTDQTQPDSVRKPLINIAITKREAEVLLLLGNGHPQIEVAKILGISVRTVKMYRSFLKDKLGLNSTAKLAKYCHQYQESIELVAKGNSSRLR